MTAVISRVKKAVLRVEGTAIAAIGRGMIIYVGAEEGDTVAEASKLAAKCASLRIFEDSDGKMNIDSITAGCGILVVSNFTLCGDARKGARPSFSKAAKPEAANDLIDKFISHIRKTGIVTEHGVFGADMEIENIADGPVTLVINSKGGQIL